MIKLGELERTSEDNAIQLCSANASFPFFMGDDDATSAKFVQGTQNHGRGREDGCDIFVTLHRYRGSYLGLQLLANRIQPFNWNCGSNFHSIFLSVYLGMKGTIEKFISQEKIDPFGLISNEIEGQKR